MSQVKPPSSSSKHPVRTLRTYPRFTLGQRWEHALLFMAILVLVLTGLPQKYRAAEWSQQILSTPERVAVLQQIHHIAALVLVAIALYHLGRAVVLMSRRRMPGDMFPTFQDIRDAWQMLLYLLFLKKEKPAFGKYNFEQKITYWFVFFGIGILGVSGFILWFPELFTRFLPGGIVPAAKLAHSSEAIVLVVFVVIWHFYHVHVERLNLSMFTGHLNETDLAQYHAHEFRRLTGRSRPDSESGENSA